ncbi:uncharacterized protein LOC134254924 [Saccostrea cucullata]|uniref:uncharacterized protein LOC134254924 n=1 Tax=Saccostrea cuccullata TaxID=36930 RepID=UPI002ED271F4
MKIVEQVPIYVFAGFILKQIQGVNDSQCHNDVIKTAELVENCPVTQIENDIATLRKACHLIPNECPTFEYHCVVNRFFNGTYEVCAPIKQIVLWLCTEFNKGGGVIQGSQHEKGFCRSCPVVYDSNKSYEFPECYDRVIRDVENISIKKEYQEFSTGFVNTETSTGSTTPDSATEEIVTKKDYYYIWLCSIV